MTSQYPPPASAGEPAQQPVVVREPTVAIIPTQYRPPGQSGQSGQGTVYGSPGGYGGRGGYSGSAAPGYSGSAAPGYAGSAAPGYSGSAAPGYPGSAAPGYAPPPSYYQPVIPTQYPSQYPRPVYLPPPPRRRRTGLVVVVVLVLLALFGAGGGMVAFLATGSAAGVARSVAGPGPAGAAPDARYTALADVLNRRAKAVNTRDKNLFLADIDKADSEFVKRQETVYENLIKLPFAEFGYKIGAGDGYDSNIPAEVRNKYGDQARAPGVAVIHRYEGIDETPVAAPWVPIYAQVSSQWKLVGEVKGNNDLPGGVGGQPWDAGPIVVEKGDKVVGVFSANNRTQARQLVQLADDSMKRVNTVRPSQWVGKVFMIAVGDRTVFDAYFGSSPERIEQVAAIAVPHYNDVPDWNQQATYSATRVIFNPDEIGEDPDILGQDMTHEFTHAAMGPVTTGWSPTWLVEGFAEYVSYRNVQINQESLKRALQSVTTEDLYAGEKFYNEPLNYITAWLACRMISETYGEAKLIGLYERFQETSNEDVVVSQILGIPRTTLIQNWKDYVAKQKR